MEIILEQVSKRFDHQYVLQKINTTILSGSTCGIRGINGSGKSTLCGILSGLIIPTKGKVYHRINSNDIDLVSHSNELLALTGPYHQLPDFLNCSQILDITAEKKFPKNFSKDEFWSLLEFEPHKNKLFHKLSSGMQQRFKLALTIYSSAELYIFDEPTNFLDEYWKKVILQLLFTRLQSKTVIIASNVIEDFRSCDSYITLEGRNS